MGGESKFETARWLMSYANASTLPQKLNLWRNSFVPHYNNLVSLFNSCKTTSETSQVHAFLLKTGLDCDPFATSKLLASSIQDINYASLIFNQTESPNLFMFNTILRACSISDEPQQAFLVFNKLRAQEAIRLDQFSFITTLKACARELSIKVGQGLHGIALKSGFLAFVNVKNALLNVYGVCGDIADARKVFDEFPENDLVSCNTLLGAYVRASQPGLAVEFFRQMCRGGLGVSVTTLLWAVSAFGDLVDSLGSESIHGLCFKAGFCSYLNVVTALIETYGKNGDVLSGRRIFDGIVDKDVIVWNCMIDKYAKAGLLEEALGLLNLMKVNQMKLNSSTLAGLLSACAASGSIKLGRDLSKYVEEEGLELDAVLGTALVNMFAKCGYLDKAINVFERMESKDVKAWTAMILGYGVHGHAQNAVALFYRMEEGFMPNGVTFLAVLSACSHGGLVTEAMNLFERMVKLYDIFPNIEHYGCMIDILGRAGLLEEAHNLIRRLPINGDATAWRALLAACRTYGNVELGDRVRRVLIERDSEHPADSLLLTSTYAVAGRLSDHTHQKMVEQNMSRFGGNDLVGSKETTMKETGYSTIELNNYDGPDSFHSTHEGLVP